MADGVMVVVAEWQMADVADVADGRHGRMAEKITSLSFHL